jgi:hypothetical protein
VSEARVPKRNRDPITAARLSFLDPLLKSRGWLRLSQRRFVDLQEQILHELIVHVSHEGGRRFEVRWEAAPLFVPHDRVSCPGGWLSPGGAGWEGATHEQADASMAEAAGLVERFVLPWLARRDGIEGFLAALAEETWSFVDRQLFVAGACQARMHRRAEARETLRRAVELFRERHPDPFHRATWVDSCLRLQEAMARGEEHELLESWFLRSAEARGVPRAWYEE